MAKEEFNEIIILIKNKFDIKVDTKIVNNKIKKELANQSIT